MKARIKATGEIVEVDECGQAFKDMRMDYMDMRGCCYSSEDLDFSDNTPFDYWTRLEHQYAGMAMQGILGNQTYTKNLLETSTSAKDARGIIVDASCYLAHALVEKMKEETK